MTARPANHYEARQERRRERLGRAADTADREAAGSFNRSRELLDPIPFGQPILVGHHSERGHRRTLERSDTAMRRGLDATQRAKELRHRASSVGKGGISSDDPDAIEKLRAKLAKLDTTRAVMKAINAAWRKAGKPDPSDFDVWGKLHTLVDEVEGVNIHRLVEKARSALEKFPYHAAPFPKYSLTNAGSEVRRLQKRIKALEASQDAETVERQATILGTPCNVVENVEENRLQLFFDGKPSANVRTSLKQWGFRWSRYNEAWQRQLTNNARCAVDGLASS